MDLFWRELGTVWRQLVRKPALPALAAITLALGIGANTAVFSIVNGVLLQPLPFPQPDRLVQVWETRSDGGTMRVSGLNASDWRRENHSLDHLANYSCGRAAVTGGREPVRANVCTVGRDFFTVLGVPARAGTALPPGARDFDGTPAAVISHGFWQREMGGRADFTGVLLDIYGYRHPVVGVMPPGFDFPDATDVWFADDIFPRPLPESRSAHNYSVIGRLRDGVSIAQAAQDFDALQRRIVADNPESDAIGAQVRSLHEEIVGSSRQALLVLFCAAGLVLLLTVANVANLLLARAADRRQEFAVRIALGAGPHRLLRQLLAEALLLALAGGAAGVLLARGLVASLPALGIGDLPRLDEVQVDWTVLAVTCAVSLGAAVLLGVAPALAALRLSPNDTLKSGGRSDAAGARSGRVRHLLVVSEVALAVILLVGAGLLTASLARVLEIQPGFRPERLLALQVELPADRYPGAIERMTFFTELEERARALPGVEEAGWVSNVPMEGFTPNGRILFEGRPQTEDAWGDADYRIVSANYFRTMGIPLLGGRMLEPTDRRDGEHVLLVNEAFVRRYYPGEDPLGRRIQVAGFEPGQDDLPQWLTIVGVVGDVRQRALDRETRPETYVPLTQRAGFTGWELNLVVRAHSEAADPAPALRSTVHGLDPGLPLTFRVVSEIVADSYAERRFRALLVGGFAFLGLLLAAIGLYGVIANSVSRRTGEFGIRMTLGAGPHRILALVLRQGLGLVALGAAVGLAGALALTRLMSGLLFGIAPTDPLIYSGVLAVVVVVALAACIVPARRASRVDPLVALRDT